MDFVVKPIGIIHSPYINKELTPIQPSRSQAIGTVEVLPDYGNGLQDIEEFSHIILLYIFHKSEGYKLLVKPFLDSQLRGLFATRYPCRPNQIGLSIVRLLSRRENILEIEGVDVLDCTPLLDIKPYVPDFDVRTEVKNGWYAHRSKQ